MKISIRFSILSIVLTLLIGISALITGIGYFAFDSILIAAAKSSLNYASGEVGGKIGNYFTSLNDDTSTVFQMFDSGAITPEYSDRFIQFLHGLISGDENVIGAYWGDATGSWYWVNKVDNGGFAEQITLSKGNGSETIEKLFDAHGKLISVKKLPLNSLDPRSRPWYQQAQLKKRLIWIVYDFLHIGTQEKQPGVTAAFPFYDAKGNLLGVFGVDMLIGAIAKYVQDIKVTKNSFVSVVDYTGSLISIHNTSMGVFKEGTLPNVVDLDDHLLKKSFAIYNQTHQTPFIYSFGNNKYISAYKQINGVQTEHPWFISIITPIDDITAPLRESVLIALLLSGVALIVGVILASIFSSSLSRPIRKLAQDANLICHLRLIEVKETFSRITEITEMDEYFMQMKNALISFQRYMPIALVKKLVASNKAAVVGGETKELTLIFTDIQDFTQLSENINPQELMQYLSRYFQVITKVVIDMNGTVDKYMGDGMMAFWGAPMDDSEHASHACQAVLQMQSALKHLNEEWLVENKPVVTTRIGVNTGRVVVGNVGSDDRLNYTSLGDPVNLANRLENLNKVYGTSAIVSEFTYNKVKNEFKFRLLDKVAAKGKKQGVFIYELLGSAATEPGLKLEQYNQEFFAAFSHYESGDWQVAMNLFNSLGKKHPEDKVVKMFIERCLIFSAKPPVNWNGVWIMTEK